MQRGFASDARCLCRRCAAAYSEGGLVCALHMFGGPFDAVNASGASCCLVGLGGGRQEKWIMKYRDRMPGVTLWLPLGGTIDYESGTFARPPSWITEWGFEWLYRLLREPRARFHRYVIHEPPFLWAVFKQRFGWYRDPLSRGD